MPMTWSGSSRLKVETSPWCDPSSLFLPDQVRLATSIFPGRLVSFPVKYLAMPLAVAKLPRGALQPLLDNMAYCLPTWRGRLLRRSGRLMLIKTTLSVVPIHTSISLDLPPWLLRAMRKLMTTFLWTGTDVVQGGKCLMAWERVQRPLHLGGLGVLDLNLFGIALRTRWLWLCYMDTDHPWAFMTIAADRQTSSFFFALVHFRPGNGHTFIFWVDPWLDGKRISEIAPRLVDVVPCRRRRQLSVSQALHGMVWTKDIKGALTIPVLV
jgi:hypothetical protein